MAHSDSRKRISVIIPRHPSTSNRPPKRARLIVGTSSHEAFDSDSDPSSVTDQLQDQPSPPCTLRSGRTWKPIPECTRVVSARRDTISSVAVSTISVSSNDEISSAPSKKSQKQSISSAPFTPAYQSTHNQKAKSCQIKAQIKSTANSKSEKEKSVIQKKKEELERIKIRQAMRSTRIKSLSDQLMSQLVGLGNLSRDVQKTCSEKLSWSGDFWREYLKKKHDRILIIRPPTQLIKNKNKNNKSVLKNWPINLEVDALELCILESGGDSPICVIDWTEIGNPEKFTTVFVHRLCSDELCDNLISPLWQMTMSERPRVQVFEFGHIPTSNTSSTLELILKAGAVMIPTMKCLLERVKDSEKTTYYRRLQIAQQSNPILRVFMSRLDAPKSKDLTDLPIDEAIELLTKFDFSNDQNSSSLETFVLSKKSGLEVLEDTYGDGENEDEEAEIKEIVGALLAIRKACWKHFRRYIIVVDSHSPLLKQTDREILCGLEIMSIQLACELAEKGPL